MGALPAHEDKDRPFHLAFLPPDGQAIMYPQPTSYCWPIATQFTGTFPHDVVVLSTASRYRVNPVVEML